MSEHRSEATSTEVDVASVAGRASVAGPAWATITIVAILGVIVMAWRAMDLSGDAIRGTQQERPSEIAE